MTPDSPAPSDGKPLPQRPRPSLESLGKDTTEQDLWDFGDDTGAPTEPLKKNRVELPKKSSNDPISRKKGIRSSSSDILRIVEKPQRSSLGLNALKETHSELDAIENEPPAEDELPSEDEPSDENKLPAEDDADTPIEDSPDETPETPAPAAKNPLILGDIDEWEELGGEPVDVPEPEAEETPAASEETTETTPAPAEAAPAAKENKPRSSGLFKFRFSTAECFSIGIFVLLLAGVAVFFTLNSLKRIPEPPKQLTPKDFPIAGKHFSAASVETYWRKPVLTGDRPDPVRRGTTLIPVLKISTKGGSGAIRVVFYDHDGNSVGDVISRSVGDGATVEVAATAGFENTTMHSAYRTGDMKPWMVEVHEGPSQNARGNQFSKLFKIAVSPALH